ncbi:MAG: hypothetical protein EOO07_30940 [Chitinophagaceae bacterium]|nr:MAG: hypothetical protein EOO07_30940 [Chitinophagaceae bacterium]
MGAVNFYLKKPEPSTGKSLIYLKFKYSHNGDSRVLVYTFGQTIDPGPKLKTGGYKNWDSGSQRVKSNRFTTADGKHSLNDLLDTLEEVLTKAYNTEIKNGIPEPGLLKLRLIQFMNKQGEGELQSDFYTLVERFKTGEIKHRGKDKSKNTTKTYNTVIQHLKAFEVSQRYPITFDTITLNFYHKYVDYLKKKKGLAQNTIAKHIQVIKVFMSIAFGIHIPKLV